MKPLCALAALAFICGHASAADKQRDPVRPTRPSLDSSHKNYANAGDHDLGGAKTFALLGQACAEVLLEIGPTKIAK